MIIKRGSEGQDVIELQEALKALGFKVGIVDGDFGPATELQVERFQESAELHPDGIVGKGTLKEINEALEQAGEPDLKFKFEFFGFPNPDLRIQFRVGFFA